jgi:hypothetical protein
MNQINAKLANETSYKVHLKMMLKDKKISYIFSCNINLKLINKFKIIKISDNLII